MIILELRKPLYEWRVLGPGEGSDLFLSPDVEQWLQDQKVDYDYRVEHEERDLGNGLGLTTYLIFYIDIEDPKDAMLFKLRWM